MKWKITVLTLLIFLALSVTGQAQAALGTAEAYSAAGAGLAIGGSAIVVTHLSQPIDSPAARMAARRAAYNEAQAQPQPAVAPGWGHAKDKHGEVDVQQSLEETSNVNDPDVETHHCKDGRDRTVNWRTNAIRVEENGRPVTAFHYESKYYLKKALLRDGCIEEPTLPVGHDDVRQVPARPYSVTTTQAGPTKTGTPSALEIAMARRAAGAAK